jgi:hypothetical protein
MDGIAGGIVGIGIVGAMVGIVGIGRVGTGVGMLGLLEIGIINDAFIGLSADFMVTDAKNISAKVARAYDKMAQTRANIQNGNMV